MKYCPSCKTDKEDSGFCFRNKAKGIRQPYCDPCRRAKARELYNKDNSGYVRRAQTRIALVVEKYNQLKSRYGCLLCGEEEPSAIDHHHLHDKDSELAALIKRGSMERIIAEINKGIFLCANCHRKYHAGVVKLPVDTKPLNILHL